MDTTSMILKSDSRGRVRTPPERREALLAEFGRSGLSARKFSAMAGVRCQTFATWVQQRRRATGTPARSTPKKELGTPGELEAALRLVEAVKEDEVVGSVRVELPGGARVDMSHRDQAGLVAALLRALEITAAGSC
jgi:hypothetical protein